MSRICQFRRVGLLLLLPLLIGAGVAWHFRIPPFGQPHPWQNSLLLIAPYRYQGTWVFDDESVGLSREPFVSGMPEMIDVLVKDIPNADSGCSFHRSRFPAIKRNSLDYVAARKAITTNLMIPR